MFRTCCPTLMFFLLVAMPVSFANNQKTKIELPDQLKAYVIENMRQNLAAFDEIVDSLAHNKLSHAANIAETYLGNNAKSSKRNEALKEYLPIGMQQFNNDLANAASHFSQTAKTGDAMQALASFEKVSSACVLCHSAYKF